MLVFVVVSCVCVCVCRPPLRVSFFVQVPEAVLKQLEALISSLIGQSSTFGTAVLTSEHLLKIVDLFRGMRKVVLCKVHMSCIYWLL
jgi:hypothetical protein